MIRIGYNLLTWSATISEDLYPHIERLKAIGYDGIEFAMASRDAAAYRHLGGFLADQGLGATGVTITTPETNPVSPDPAIRQAAVDSLRTDIDLAHAAGATVLCGPFHSAFATFTQQPPQDEEYEWSAAVLREAGAHAEQAGMTLAIEALNRFECYLCNTTAALRKICDLADHPAVKAMFDTHHANIEEVSFDDALDTVRPHLAHVHISENNRGTPGAGLIPFADIFAKLKAIRYDGWVTIEAFSRNDIEFANSINVWRNYAEPWDIAEGGYAMIRNQLNQEA